MQKQCDLLTQDNSTLKQENENLKKVAKQYSKFKNHLYTVVNKNNITTPSNQKLASINHYKTNKVMQLLQNNGITNPESYITRNSWHKNNLLNLKGIRQNVYQHFCDNPESKFQSLEKIKQQNRKIAVSPIKNN